MFADDTNLFLTHKNISYLFETANLQLERINQWFISNKFLQLERINGLFHINCKQNKVLIFSQTEQKGRCSVPFTKMKYK